MFEKVEKTGIISTKFSLPFTPSVILGINFKNSDFCKLLRLCAISALQITKKHFAKFDFFVKMKLVLIVWVSTSRSKFGY